MRNFFGVYLSVILGALPFPGIAKSLFFPKMDTYAHLPSSGTEKKFPSIEGIFYREDLGTWIVWINGERIDSEHAITSDGWVIISINEKEIILSDPSTKKNFTFHVLDVLSSTGKDPKATTPPEAPPPKKE